MWVSLNVKDKDTLDEIINDTELNPYKLVLPRLLNENSPYYLSRELIIYLER
jgi:hypothetical protein